MENEEELIVYQDQHNLITLGWIHVGGPGGDGGGHRKDSGDGWMTMDAAGAAALLTHTAVSTTVGAAIGGKHAT